MTREEAIKWVKFVHDVLYEDKDEDIRTALDMAIEALSEPSKVDYRTDESANIGTKVNDLISRTDAIEAVRNDNTNHHGITCIFNSYNCCAV